MPFNLISFCENVLDIVHVCLESVSSFPFPVFTQIFIGYLLLPQIS